MADLPLQNKLSQDTNGRMRFRLLTSELGNGQAQVAFDGLNARIQTFTLLWSGLTLQERDTVINVLDLSGGVDTLRYIPPSGPALNLRITDGYAWNTSGGDIYTVSVDVIQDFR